MRQLAIILFVLFYVLVGKSQSSDLSKNQIIDNSVFLVNGNSSGGNPLLFQNEYFDVQDSNDYGSFDSDFVLPDSQNYFHHSEIEIVAVVLPRLRLIQVSELLLDLPPPSLSI